MSYFNRMRGWWATPKSNLDPMMQVRANELIFVLNPSDTAALDLPPGHVVKLTGLSGIIRVTLQGSIYDYRVKNGQTLELPSAGLMVFQSMTENVPGKLQVSVTRKPSH